jgi:hypothetical protein
MIRAYDSDMAGKARLPASRTRLPISTQLALTDHSFVRFWNNTVLRDSVSYAGAALGTVYTSVTLGHLAGRSDIGANSPAASMRARLAR